MRFYLVLIVGLLASSIVLSAGLSPRAYRQLNDLQLAVTEAKTDEQRIELKGKLLELKSDLAYNATGLALTLQTLAQLSYIDNDSVAAITYLNEALLITNLDKVIYLQIASYLSQILFNTGKYEETIAVLESVISKRAPEDLAFDYALLAASFYSLNKIEDGLPYIEKAITLKESPKEAWLQMAFSGNVQIKNYNSAISAVNRLIYNYPQKKEYWLQKSSVHQLRGEFDVASYTKELAYTQGHVTSDSDFINLGQLLASQGDPYKVAKLLEHEIERGQLERSEKIQRLIYSAFLEAKEIPLAIRAMMIAYESYKNKSDGLLLSQYLVENELWSEGLDVLMGLLAMRNSLQEQLGEVYFLLGVCQFRLGESKNALISFGKSTEFPRSSSKAKSWMSYVKQFDR